MTDLPFEPISRSTVSEQIRLQLLQKVTTGELAPGSRVPSERALAEQFGVARTSVREAMQGLVSMGMVERRGNRSHVVEHLPEISLAGAEADATFVADLFETRRLLEASIFELATQRADDNDRQTITEMVGRFDPDLDVEEFRQLDRAFRTRIASCCGNPLLIELHRKVLDRLSGSDEVDSMLRTDQKRTTIDKIVADSSAANRAIADAFISGDAARCRTLTLRHLDQIETLEVPDLA